jgi:hypothetical protein
MSKSLGKKPASGYHGVESRPQYLIEIFNGCDGPGLSVKFDRSFDIVLHLNSPPISSPTATITRVSGESPSSRFLETGGVCHVESIFLGYSEPTAARTDRGRACSGPGPRSGPKVQNLRELSRPKP